MVVALALVLMSSFHLVYKRETATYRMKGIVATLSSCDETQADVTTFYTSKEHFSDKFKSIKTFFIIPYRQSYLTVALHVS